MKKIIYKKNGETFQVFKDWTCERIEAVMDRMKVLYFEIINGKFKSRYEKLENF
jgi:hypothetical protein